jgi:4-hydroxybenzoate polyprenyltransferase
MDLSGSTISFQHRVKLFMALSRTPHGLLDMATPALAAILWLGAIPPVQVIVIGIITTFAGYTAVYALNDVVDFKTDRRRFRECGAKCSAGDLDAIYARQPLAQGLLGLWDGIAWTVAWGTVALLGAWLLNPACAFIFVLGCIAETVYCLMLRLSWTRVLVSGGVKTAGGLAAIYAVAPNSSLSFIAGFFMWFFFWEIGGQNVPNDWSDMEEDRRMGAETVPVKFGTHGSARIILCALTLAVIMSFVLFWLTPARLGVIYFAGAVPAGIFLLLVPAWRLYAGKNAALASALFNRASYYPLTMFISIFISILA